MFNVNRRCENCGKFPFCKFADKNPKENCGLWEKRNIDLKLIDKDETGFTFDKIE